MRLCTHLGLRAVLGQVSVLVAVSTLDVLTRVVSVGHALHTCPAAPLFVIDPSLKHTVSALQSWNVWCRHNTGRVSRKLWGHIPNCQQTFKPYSTITPALTVLDNRAFALCTTALYLAF